jgi:predicted lysophospholipase L1 biosynthesis ABC-type transport system permease subunit
MKTRMYWSYASRSLVRGGQRTVLAIFCVAVGVLAIVSLQLVTNAVTAGFTGNVRALNGGDLQITADTPLTPAQLGYFDTLKAQGIITAYTAGDVITAQVRTPTAALQITLRAVDPASFPLADGVTFTDPAGASLANVLQGNTVAITTLQATTFNLHVGDSFQFSTQNGHSAVVRVGGIIASTGAFAGPATLMAYDAYAALPSVDGQPAGYNMIFADVPGHTDTAAAKAEQVVQREFPLAATQTTKELLAAQTSNIRMITYFLRIIGLLSLLIGGVGIVNTIQVALRRRRVEIAMLKTAGYRRGDLYGLFGLETGLLGLVGGAVGALAGVGVSYVVAAVMAHALQSDLPIVVDGRTVLAGVAVGFVTALIFGLLPIVQASAVRPVAVLRELTQRAGISTRVASLALVALVTALFYLLAASILGNPLVAAIALGVTVLVLALLSLVLGVLVLGVSKLPVPAGRALVSGAVAALVAVGSVALLVAAHVTFAVLPLALAALWLALVLLPTQARSNVRLALRNIGSRKARSVATLVALTVGIFAIGLVLVLGQDIHTVLATYLDGGNVNVAIVTSAADRPALDDQLAQVPSLKNETVNPIAPVQPVAVNGEPIAQIVQAATATGKFNANDVLRQLDGVQGYDLAAGQAPNPTTYVLATGMYDTHPGRTLTAADAGGTAALLPLDATHAPLNLRLGDTITLQGQATGTQETITVVGFYNYTLDFEPIQLDSGIVTSLTGGQPGYLYLAYVDPAAADATLARIQAAIPSIQTFSVADIFAQIASILNNLVTVLVTIASLAMLAAVIIIANAVALAMLERRRELGILKAVGYTSRSVLGEVLVENATIGLVGGGLAMALVALATHLLGSFIFNATFSMPLATVAELIPAAALVCMIVAAAVAYSATRVRPLEVLRYE